MKLRWWYGIVLNLVLAVLVVSGTALYIVHRNSSGQACVLEIRDSSSRKLYGKWPLETGEFAVEFIHSVHKSPVRETFIIEGKMIRPHEARFSSFGAGMQSDLQEGHVLGRDGDALVISGFKTAFRELNYIVGTVSDHLLYINGETISLRELCGRNAHITIKPK
jgi:hypothetical protein